MESVDWFARRKGHQQEHCIVRGYIGIEGRNARLLLNDTEGGESQMTKRAAMTATALILLRGCEASSSCRTPLPGTISPSS
jgi:hypothetical protein